MRICILVNNDFVNEPRVARHAETLGEMGHNVLVICARSDRTVQFEKKDAYSIRRFDIRETSYYKVARFFEKLWNSRDRKGKVARIASIVMGTILSSYRSLCLTWQFTKLARDFDAQIYVTNDYDTLLAGVLSAWMFKKLIHDAHELWPDQFVGVLRSPVIAWYRLVEHILLKHASVVITVNEFISSELERRYHIKRPQVILNVPNRVPSIRKPELQKPIKIALYQGAYSTDRGLENLVRACEFLCADVALVIRGYGEIEAQLRELAKPFTNCRIEQPLPPNQLILAASKADVGIVPYLPTNLNNYFASPNKLFEYIQAGLPVVASDLPFLRKIITENEIGYLFDPRNPRDIANSINTATRNEILPLLRNNILRIRDHYSWNEEQRKLVKIFREVDNSSDHVSCHRRHSGLNAQTNDTSSDVAPSKIKTLESHNLMALAEFKSIRSQ
jgi:glycosyltransferase involved in cell wall biosynthesis